MVPFIGSEELKDAVFIRQHSVERWRPPIQQTPSTFHWLQWRGESSLVKRNDYKE